jgi:hypothetical protein
MPHASVAAYWWIRQRLGIAMRDIPRIPIVIMEDEMFQRETDPIDGIRQRLLRKGFRLLPLRILLAQLERATESRQVMLAAEMLKSTNVG